MQRLLVLLAATALASCAATELRHLPATASESVRNHARSCDAEDAVGCYALAIVYSLGEDTRQGVERDDAHSQALFEVACNGGIPEACEALETVP